MATPMGALSKALLKRSCASRSASSLLVRSASRSPRKSSSARLRPVMSWIVEAVRTGLPPSSRTTVALTLTQATWPSLRM